MFKTRIKSVSRVVEKDEWIKLQQLHQIRLQNGVDFIIYKLLKSNRTLFCSPSQLDSQSHFSHFELVRIHWFILSAAVGCRARNTKANCVTLLDRSVGQSFRSLRLYQTAQAQCPELYLFFNSLSFFPNITFEGQFFFPPLLSLWDVFIESLKSQGHAGVHAAVTCLFSHLEGGERTRQTANQGERRWEEPQRGCTLTFLKVL